MSNENLPAGTVARESSLSSWAGEPVTGMIGRGQALSQTPYEAYTGPLTAGPSALQTQAFQGLSSLTLPTDTQTTYNPQTFTAEAAHQALLRRSLLGFFLFSLLPLDNFWRRLHCGSLLRCKQA